MVRLPSRDDLGAIPSGRTGRGIANIDVRVPRAPDIPMPSDRLVPRVAGITQGAFDSAARELENVAVTIERERQKDDNLAAIQAKAKFDREHIELRHEIESNPDYRTYDSTFSERSSKIAEDSLAMIGDPDLRAEAEAKFSVDQARYRDGVLRTAKAKKDEADFLVLDDALKSQRLVYLDPNATDAEKIEARRSMEASIRIAQESGVITARQAATLEEQYVKGVAKEEAAILLKTNPDALDAELNGVAPYERWLIESESGGDPTIMERSGLGYAGLYQFGAPQLVTLGLYKFGEGESFKNGTWQGKKWTGEFNIPGFPDVKTLEDFLANPDAQRVAFAEQVKWSDKEIKERGLEKYIGTSVGGVTITREGIYAMFHLGGAGGTSSFLRGGKNSKDINDTTLLHYASGAANHSRVAGLDPVDRADLQVKATRGSRLNKLLIDISEGRAGEEDILQAQKDGWLTDYQDLRSAEIALDRANKQTNFQAGVSALSDPIRVWDPLDSDNKKILSAVIEEGDGLQKIVAGDQEYIEQGIIPMFERTGMLPPAVKGAFQAATRSSDVKTVTVALANMDRLEQINPQAFRRDMGEDAVKKVVRYREQLAYRTPEEIVEEMRRSEEPGRAQARKDAITEGRKIAAEIRDGDITDHFDLGMFYSEPGGPVEPLTARELRKDFERLFAEEYAETGDESIAKASALKLLEGVWGTTDSTGTRQLMKYPPERFYQVQGLGPEWMTEQAAEDLAPYRKDGEEFVFRADAKTEAQIARGQPPEYLVIIEREDGTFEPLHNSETNEFIRMRFDPKPYIEKKQEDMKRRREEFGEEHAKTTDVLRVTEGSMPKVGSFPDFMSPGL